MIDFYHIVALSRMSIVHNKSSTLSSRAQSLCQKTLLILFENLFKPRQRRLTVDM